VNIAGFFFLHYINAVSQTNWYKGVLQNVLTEVLPKNGPP